MLGKACAKPLDGCGGEVDADDLACAPALPKKLDPDAGAGADVQDSPRRRNGRRVER